MSVSASALLRLPAAFLLAAVTALAGPAAASVEEDAAAFVTQLGNRLIAVLETPSGEKRHAAFAQWLHESFDLELLAERALGPYRSLASGSELAAYRQAFVGYIEVVYEDRLDMFVGYRFDVKKTRAMSDRDVIVRTRVTGPDGAHQVVDFRLGRGDDDSFQVFDIAVEGLSMLRTQREEFGAVIQRDGMAGLVERLRTQTDSVLSLNAE